MDTDIRSQLATLEYGLRRYLPEQQLSALLRQPTLVETRACASHLGALLHAVSTYLPRYIVQEQLADPRPGQVSGQFRDATIMFADISGFTAMSERLSRQGEQGAEKITNIVGDYFTTMLDVTGRYGGDLLKFGGDALLVAFFGRDHEIAACQAAAQMQQAIERFRQVEAFGETFGLKMTVGLGSGPLFAANLGTVDKMEYTVMGEALANMAHAEDQAEGGEIFIDEATYQVVCSQVRISEIRNGCYKVTHVAEDASDPAPEPGPVLPCDPEQDLSALSPAQLGARIHQAVTCLDALVPFLPPGLLDLLRFDPARMASRERGEFRPVTVAFCNFYGIEEIIRRLGPAKVAEITAILNAHFSEMQAIINRYEGVIDKVDSYVVGHRIMALFGAPRAHVDDPERAVRTAWEMQAAMSSFSELETSAGVFALKQRIGINTGRVFAGNVGSEQRHEYSVMGDEVNLTARLMSAAQEGQVLISQSTAAQVGARFRLDAKAPVKVKGKSQPVPNYEVLAPHTEWAVSGAQASSAPDQPSRARLPLVGRDREWQVVRNVAAHVLGATPHPRVLEIYGEMGMGKSRLVEELLDHWTGQGGSVLWAGCVSYGQHTPYAPWSTILRQVFGLRQDDPDQARREKITGRLAATPSDWANGSTLDQWAPLVAQILGVSMPEGDLLRSLDPKLRQQNLQRVVTDLILSECEAQPTLLVLDDIQWADEASLSLLNHAIVHAARHRAAICPLLICYTYRSTEYGTEEAPPVSIPAAAQPGHTAVVLEALDEAQSLALLNSQLPPMLEEMARESGALAERWQQLKGLILKNAQGNPLFIVEMAHALIENYMLYDPQSDTYRARTDLARIQVPDTVSRVILSRLDRLDEQSRNMLKVASAIGRAFEGWLLQAVYPYRAGQAELDERLAALCRQEILDRARSSADVAYLFRHVMTREVTYESLLYAERRDLHRSIARSIEAQLEATGSTTAEYVEVLAEHHTLAENWSQATDYQLYAGRRAQSIYANEDAIHRFREALKAAERVPESEARQLEAHERLSEVLAISGEYQEALVHNYQAIALVMATSVTAEDMAVRIAELCRETAAIHEKRSEYGTAADWLRGGLIALEGLEVIEAARIYLLGAGIYRRQGRNDEAVEWCQKSLDIAQRIGTQEGRQAMARAYYNLGGIYTRQGDLARAAEFCRESLRIYQEIDDLVEQPQAHINLANVYFELGDWPRSTEHYIKALELERKIGDVYHQALTTLNLGGVYLNQGDLDQADRYYRQSLDMWQDLGSNYAIALLYNNRGTVALRRGDAQEALAMLQQSLALFEQIGSGDWLAEVYRHMAEAHLISIQTRPSPQALQKALDCAQRSLALAQEQELRMEEGIARRVLGQALAARSARPEAERLLQESVAILEGLDNPYELGQTLFQTALLCQEQGDGDRAEQALCRAIALFETLGAKLDLAQALAFQRACQAGGDAAGEDAGG
jgi:class 3 adenylate cyclase/predicted ATPase